MAEHKERLKKACPRSCGYCQETTKEKGNIMSKVRLNLILVGRVDPRHFLLDFLDSPLKPVSYVITN